VKALSYDLLCCTRRVRPVVIHPRSLSFTLAHVTDRLRSYSTPPTHTSLTIIHKESFHVTNGGTQVQTSGCYREVDDRSPQEPQVLRIGCKCQVHSRCVITVYFRWGVLPLFFQIETFRSNPVLIDVVSDPDLRTTTYEGILNLIGFSVVPSHRHSTCHRHGPCPFSKWRCQTR